MDLQKIKRLVVNRRGGLKKLAADIHMTEANLHRCINLNKIQAGELEKIAHLLGVRVGYFFDEVEINETCAATCDTVTATGPGAVAANSLGSLTQSFATAAATPGAPAAAAAPASTSSAAAAAAATPADTIESLRAERDALLTERDTLRQSLLDAQSRLLSLLCP